ncbi:MAG: transposase [Thermoanaerobaculales bacterium]
MPRRAREFVAGAIYHVTCGTVRGEPVLAGLAEVEALLGVVGEVTRRDGLAVLAWCVLPDRYHLALRCGEVPIWRTMRSLQGRAAREINRQRGAAGALWQGRYAAVQVAGAHARRLVAYIHARPVARGLADEAAAFAWSGHRDLLGGGRGPIEVAEVMRFFAASPAAARRAYADEVASCLAAPWGAAEPGRLPWWRRRGEEAPAQAVVGGAAAPGGGRVWEPATFPAEIFLDVAARTLEVTLDYLSSHHSDRARTRLRQLVAWVAVERCGVRGRELARVLGRHPVVVSRWISAARVRKSRDETFRRRCEALAASLDDRLARYRTASSDFVSGADASFVD